MARQDSNIDPFNAGEPILPWNDSAQLHDEDGCVFDDQPYNAPSKRQDDLRGTGFVCGSGAKRDVARPQKEA